MRKRYNSIEYFWFLFVFLNCEAIEAFENLGKNNTNECYLPLCNLKFGCKYYFLVSTYVHFLSTVKNLNSSYARIFLPQGEKYLSYDIKVNKIA